LLQTINIIFWEFISKHLRDKAKLSTMYQPTCMADRQGPNACVFANRGPSDPAVKCNIRWSCQRFAVLPPDVFLIYKRYEQLSR